MQWDEAVDLDFIECINQLLADDGFNYEPEPIVSLSYEEVKEILPEVDEFKDYLEFNVEVNDNYGTSIYYDCDEVSDSNYNWGTCSTKTTWYVSKIGSFNINECGKVVYSEDAEDLNRSNIGHNLGGAAFEYLYENLHEEEMNCFTIKKQLIIS